MPYCSVPFCKSNSYNCKDVRFHEFPCDMPTRELWIKVISRRDEDGNLWLPKDRSRVCSKHFYDDDFRSGLKVRKLKPGTVPTIFPNYPLELQRKITEQFRRPEEKPRQEQTVPLEPVTLSEQNNSDDDEDDDDYDDDIQEARPSTRSNGEKEKLSSANVIIEHDYSQKSHKDQAIQTSVSVCFTKKVATSEMAKLLLNANNQMSSTQQYCNAIQNKQPVDSQLSESTFEHSRTFKDAVSRSYSKDPILIYALQQLEQKVSYLRLDKRRFRNSLYRLQKKITELTKEVQQLQKKNHILSQYEKVFCALEDGLSSNNQCALFLQDQLASFGRERHKWTDNTLKICSLWRQQSVDGYEFARKANILKLPSRTTLKRHAPNHTIVTVTAPGQANFPVEKESVQTDHSPEEAAVQIPVGEGPVQTNCSSEAAAIQIPLEKDPVQTNYSSQEAAVQMETLSDVINSSII